MTDTKKEACNYTLRLPSRMRAAITKIAAAERRSLHAQIMVLVEEGLANGGSRHMDDPPADRAARYREALEKIANRLAETPAKDVAYMRAIARGALAKEDVK